MSFLSVSLPPDRPYPTPPYPTTTPRGHDVVYHQLLEECRKFAPATYMMLFLDTLMLILQMNSTLPYPTLIYPSVLWYHDSMLLAP